MIIYRTSGYIGAILIIGILFSVFNKSLLYGYFIFYPILTIVLMLFIPSELHSNWKDEWRNWIRNDSLPFLYSFAIILASTLYFLILYNINAILAMNFTIPIFNWASIPYLVLGLGSGVMDY